MVSPKKDSHENPNKNQRSLSVWLTGRLQQDAYQSMAERIAWDVSEPNGRPPTLIIYEPAIGITIGRLGSHTDIDISMDELSSKGIPVRFVGRGGLFAPLEKLGLSSYDVGGFLERFEFGLESAIQSLRCSTVRDSRQPGIFGRSGLIATVSIAVRRGVVWHGGFVNVCPDLGLYRQIDTVPVATGMKKRTMGSVQAEIRRKVRLQDVRTAIVRSMVDAFGCGDVSIQSGMPVFQNTETRSRDRITKSA